MAQRKVVPVWTSLEPIFREALENYVHDNEVTISEFVRAIIIERLQDEGYVTEETVAVAAI